jgi:hypothetical protein
MTTTAQLDLTLDACAATDHDTADCSRCIEAAFADGRFYLQVDAPSDGDRIGGYIGQQLRDRVRVVHVISKPAGGEIRGYVVTEDRALRLRTPCYSGHWPALDEAVRTRTGAGSIAPYTVSDGGAVRGC